MATLNDANPTLLDFIKMTNPDGTPAKIIEALSKQNSVITDMTAIEGNLTTGHRVTAEYALPSVGWRNYNQGVAASKGRDSTVDETCGMLEGRSVVDCELAKINGNEAAYRANRDMRFARSMKNEVESGMFYHSTSLTPEKFQGLSPRLNSTSAPFDEQLVLCDSDASGNDQYSAWYIFWHPDAVTAIFPKGDSGGLKMHDMGEQLVDDEDGLEFRAFVTIWNWKIGLCVADARQICRVGNIDQTKLNAGTSSLIEGLIAGYHQIGDPTLGRGALYMNRATFTALHLLAMQKSLNATFSTDRDLENGQPLHRFLGVPIRVTDALITENLLS